MTKKGLDRMDSGTVCTARRRNGTQCLNYAIKGATVCRMHGGSAPQVRRAAQVRLLMQADNLMGALLKIALNEKLPVQHRLVAIRDGLDRADLSGKTNVEVTVEKGKTFEDFVGEAIIDVEEDDDTVMDAVVIEDDDVPLAPRDPDATYEGNRFDRAAFAEVERSHTRRVRPGGMTDEQRARAEAKAMAELKRSDAADRQADVDRDREAMLLAKANGTWNPSSRGDAMREAAKTDEQTGKRRARVSDATFSEDRRRKRRRE